MSGGLGTLEEAVETWNAIKIGELDKKIGFLNVDDYFIKLFSFMEHCNKNGFITAEQIAIPSAQVGPKKLLSDLA
jgi:predicted Rossmann-fold nucleotide-binding protein